MRGTQMGIGMRAILNLGKHTAKVCTTGPMARSMMASGAGGSKTGMACGEGYSGTATWASGKTQKHMAMESISGRTETDMKGLGPIALNTGKDLTFLQMEMSTLANTSAESLRAKESTSGKTVLFTQANSRTA